VRHALVELDDGNAGGPRRIDDRMLERAAPAGLDVDLVDGRAGRQCLRDDLGPFGDERALLGTRAAAAEEPPQPLDLLVLQAEGQRVLYACLASSQRRPKAVSSVTARSARTFRSTSTPAVFSPATRRL
jgi:hypothetical protein